MTETAARKLTSVLSDSFTAMKRAWEPVRKALFFSLADETISPAQNVFVSIEGNAVSVAYGTRSLSRIKIKGFKQYSFDEKYPAPETLASSVVLAISALKAAKADITLGIPKSWAVIKTAVFPATVRDSISDVVSYEMDRLTPFGHEEAFFDFRVLKDDGERITLLIVAAKADLLERYLSALREKGHEVKRVTLNLSCVGTLCRFAGDCEDAVLVKVGEKEYEGAVFSLGLLTASFAGSLEGDERARLDAVMTEIEARLADARREGGSPRLILSLKDRSSTLKEMLKLRLNTPFAVLEEMDLPLGLSAKEIPHEAVGGVIDSLWPWAKGFSLLGKGRRERVKAPVVLTAILVTAVIAMWALYLVAPVKIEGNRLREIERQITLRKDEMKKVEALKKDIEALEGEISTIRTFKENRPFSLNILKELTTILPRTAWLTRVRITETTVDIEGYAASASELLARLEASKYLDKVEFSSPTFRDARMNADRFNIKMELEGARKKEEKPKEGEKPKVEKK